MKFIDRLNEALEYVEENLDSTINFNIIRDITLLSKPQFLRLFSIITDSSFSEYIRKRKMSKAALDIKYSDEKIIDIANKYGYDSAGSFNRAFRSFQGISPLEMRNKDCEIRSIPPLNFKVKIVGGNEMKYKLVEKEGFNIIGRSIPISDEFEENIIAVPEFWNQMKEDHTIDDLITRIDQNPQGVVGVNSFERDHWKYYIGIISDSKDHDYEVLEVPNKTWAVFSCHGGPREIQDLYRQVFTEWLPSSGYEYDQSVDLEVYRDELSDHMNMELWIPLVPKK